MTTEKFKHGDIVRYTAQFLRNTGQYTGNAINGLIVESKPSNLYLVRWCDRPDSVHVHGSNIEIDQRIGDAYQEQLFNAIVNATTGEALNVGARDQVERELHSAGIIEDPDMDGGILG